MKLFYLILLITVWKMTSCITPVATKNLPRQEELKRQIIYSIQLPFTSLDTIVCRDEEGICVSSSKEVIDRYFIPRLNKPPYDSLLKERFGKRLIFHVAGKDFPTDDKDDIYLSIYGETVTNTSVRISESYTFNNESAFIEKLYTFSDDKWTFKITTSEKDTLKR